MKLLAIDPGPVESAYLVYEDGYPLRWGKVPNAEVLTRVDILDVDKMAIEMVASYGMAVGATVFETCVWAGRFIERWTWRVREGAPRRIYRRDVKLHLCNSARAKDANVRQAIIDRYGGKWQAIGKKNIPGPLYGLTKDCWAALGVAITADETKEPT